MCWQGFVVVCGSGAAVNSPLPDQQADTGAVMRVFIAFNSVDFKCPVRCGSVESRA